MMSSNAAPLFRSTPGITPPVCFETGSTNFFWCGRRTGCASASRRPWSISDVSVCRAGALAFGLFE